VASLSIFSETKDQLIGFGVEVIEGAAVGAGVEVGAGVDVSFCPLAQPIDPEQYANMRIVVKIHVNFFMVRYRNATTFYILYNKVKLGNYYTHTSSLIFEASVKHYTVCSGKSRLSKPPSPLTYCEILLRNV
jgi:hypothetical protein